MIARVIDVLWWLGYHTHNRTMDTLFGKPEPFEFTGSTLPRTVSEDTQG